MRILIVGAGGIGGYFGAYLLAAGRDVTFLVRPGRAAQLAANGLELLSEKGGDRKLPPPPTLTAPQLADSPQAFDLILLSCKAYDLESAIADFAPAVGPSTAVLPLLNGMAHIATLDLRFGRERVVGGLTTVSAAKEEDGRILHLNPLDALQFGDRDQPEGERARAIFEILTAPGFSIHLSTVIEHDMWQKWIAISTAAGATCLLRASIGDIVAAGAAPLVHTLLAETSSIATAEGFAPTQDHLEVVLSKFTQPGSSFTTSMLRDIEAGSAIEEHQIIGDLLHHARRRNVPTPLLDVVHAHLRCYEERRNRERNS